MRDAAGKLNHFDAACNFAFGVGKNLAVFGGDDFGQMVGVFIEQMFEIEQDLSF